MSGLPVGAEPYEFVQVFPERNRRIHPMISGNVYMRMYVNMDTTAPISEETIVKKKNQMIAASIASTNGPKKYPKTYHVPLCPKSCARFIALMTDTYNRGRIEIGATIMLTINIHGISLFKRVLRKIDSKLKTNINTIHTKKVVRFLTKNCIRLILFSFLREKYLSPSVSFGCGISRGAMSVSSDISKNDG